ncbi:hypothetical protein F4779DRAFT_565232 [Xylariaceae sp. FL0662B]|nr:hypothetical protein F4779DRAFT_565232 [Xylariaceae sp. FL0662B]
MSSQWSQGVVPPPPGVTPNFVDPPDQLEKNITIHTIFLTLSTVSVVMRIYTRLCVSRVKLGVDDYLCLFSFGATASFSGLLFASFSWGIGRHIWDEPVAWLVSGLKFETIAAQIYLVAATSIKLSLLFLYRRIFNLQTKAKFFVNAGIVVVLLVNIALLLAIIFFCIPVQKAWDNSIEGKCTSPAPVSYFTGVWNAVVDIYVLVLPIPLLWGLNMGPRRKLRLGAVFGIGIFACAASLVRLGMTPLLQSDLDATYNIATVSVWATLEINVGLICSCLMLLPAFLRHHVPESTKSYLRSISFTRSSRSGQSGKTSKNTGGQWPGYKLKVSSDSQNLVPSKEGTQIVRTNTFTLETVHVPDLERGERSPHVTRF